MSNTRSTPKPKVPNRSETFDLDILEKDGEAPKPLPVRLGGEEFVFNDLDEADYWAELAEAPAEEDVETQLRIMLGEEQYERFRAKPLKGWKLNALMKRLDDHFGFTKRMGSQGEGNGSSTS
jgi:hypothetical protein